jgi:hypothetical protein
MRNNKGQEQAPKISIRPSPELFLVLATNCGSDRACNLQFLQGRGAGRSSGHIVPARPIPIRGRNIKGRKSAVTRVNACKC